MKEESKGLPIDQVVIWRKEAPSPIATTTTTKWAGTGPNQQMTKRSQARSIRHQQLINWVETDGNLTTINGGMMGKMEERGGDGRRRRG
jgi:hypothetical protein